MNQMLENKFALERTHYPALRHFTYLDHASGGLYPEYSTKAMKDYLDNMSEYSMTFQEFTETWDFADKTREDIAGMLNCKSHEIMYGLSSTWLYNVFINGIDLQPGDNVITTSTSHASVPYILLNQEQNGVEVRIFQPENGATRPEDIFGLIDEHTKAICLCYVENTYGFKHDLKVYGEFCREHGIWLAVDATQGCGALKIDVEDMKIDFLTSSAYKWLCCVLGIGFAYISDRLRPQLKKVDAGWSSSADRWHKDSMKPVISEDARKFECGGISTVGLKGLAKIVQHYNKLGADDIQDYCLSLVDYLYKEVAARLTHTTVFGNFAEENRSTIVALAVPKEWGLTDEIIAKAGIRAHVPAEGIIRVGFHYYNNREDADRLIAYLKSLES